MTTHGYLVYPANLNSGGGLQVGVFFKASAVHNMTDERWQKILDACGTSDTGKTTTTTFFRDKDIALIGRLVPKELGVEQQKRILESQLARAGIILTSLPLPSAEDVRRALDPTGG